MNADWDPRRLVTPQRAPALFVALVVVAYFAVIALVATAHESWRDEADPWLYARDADLSTIFIRTRYDGFPALWLLCIAPLAKAGLPYLSQAILHLLVAAAAVGVFARYSPLTRLTKILAATSYYFAYEYAVIVRSYALTILLTCVAAALYQRRRERPMVFALVIFSLFNVNAQGFVIAGAFALLALIDGLSFVPAGIVACGAFFSWWQVRTPPDPARHAAMHIFNRDAFAWLVGNAYLPTFPVVVSFMVGMLALLAVTMAVRHAREALLFLWLPLAALAILHSYVWLGGLRHAGFFLFIPLVAIWIAGDRIGKAVLAALLLNTTLLVSDVVAARYWLLDRRAAFSGAMEMANFIADSHLLDREVAAHNLTQCEALLPYLPGKRFWYAGLGEYGTYLKWDAAFEGALNVPYPVAELRARQHFAGKPWLLLFSVEMPNPAAHGFRLLYTNQKPIFEKTDERYWLYAPLR